MHACMCVCVHACVCVYMFMHECVYMHAGMRACVCVGGGGGGGGGECICVSLYVCSNLYSYAEYVPRCVALNYVIITI